MPRLWMERDRTFLRPFALDHPLSAPPSVTPGAHTHVSCCFLYCLLIRVSAAYPYVPGEWTPGASPLLSPLPEFISPGFAGMPSPHYQGQCHMAGEGGGQGRESWPQLTEFILVNQFFAIYRTFLLMVSFNLHYHLVNQYCHLHHIHRWGPER